MTTLIKAKEIRVAANITKYQIILKLIFLRINFPKYMMIRQFFHVKNKCNFFLKSTSLKWTYELLVTIIEC